jgi:hypothetical protein
MNNEKDKNDKRSAQTEMQWLSWFESSKGAEFLFLTINNQLVSQSRNF